MERKEDEETPPLSGVYKLEVTFVIRHWICKDVEEVEVNNELHKAKEESSRHWDRQQFLNLSDFKIITRNGEEIPCHKILLAMRSEYFRAMFSRENSTPTVMIMEFEFDETVINFIDFLYLGELRKEDQYNQEMLDLADFFEVKDLKDKCQRTRLFQ